MRFEDIEGWFPVDISWEPNPPTVEWRQFGTRPFDEPFFAQSVERVSQDEAAQPPLRTPIDVLLDLDEEPGGRAPTGLIFHMSRCGSTLVTRLLASGPRNLVLAEPDPINRILGAPLSFPRDVRIRWLRGLVRAMDQRRMRSQDHFFIKLSSWNVAESAFLNEALPNIPRCFLFRDPVEVMVSLLDDSPSWLRAAIEFDRGRWLARNPPSGGTGPTPEESCARLVAHFCRTALDQLGPDALFVDYRSLPSAVWTTIASHFGVVFTPEEVARMNELARVNAKDVQGTRRFEADRDAKQERASDLIRAMAAKWLEEPFRQLDRRAVDQSR